MAFLNKGLGRKNFMTKVPKNSKILELGPLANPMAVGENVSYFDVRDTQALRDYAVSQSFDPAKVPDIQYVSETADLTIIPDTFDMVVSCHCIEHQPDLIRHLVDVLALLKPGGEYRMLVPDKRYCFDHYMGESDVGDVIWAHLEGHTNHTSKNVLKMGYMTTHNDSRRHWKGDHGPALKREWARIKEAYSRLQQRDMSTYDDCHAWRFTPASMGQLLTALKDSGLVPISSFKISPTFRRKLEFGCQIWA